MTNVTLWYVVTKDGLKYNHLEDGHSENDKPTPKFDAQKSWAGQEWKKKFGNLTNENIVVE